MGLKLIYVFSIHNSPYPQNKLRENISNSKYAFISKINFKDTKCKEKYYFLANSENSVPRRVAKVSSFGRKIRAVLYNPTIKDQRVGTC